MTQQSGQTVRLSFRMIISALTLIVLLAVAGGMLGSTFVQPNLPPLTDNQEQFVTTTQEVTISPSRAAAQLVETHDRSVVLLMPDTAQGAQQAITGVVLTNDGLVASTRDLSQDSLVAIDDTAREISVNRVGTDILYGITYYRLQDAIATPFELPSTDPKVGSQDMLLSRNPSTYSSRAHTLQLHEYILPNAPVGNGIQRFALYEAVEESVLDGSPLIDDEGRLSALLLDAQQGTALPASYVRASLDRITNNQREVTPFENVGIVPAYTFVRNPETDEVTFGIEVRQVALGSIAAGSGVRTGDIIIGAGEALFTWTEPIASIISEDLPVTITVLRDDDVRTISLSRPSPSP